ncbi:MAG: hypothetical protein KatS3mg015_2690 [Fimbriimonadales bacterium]|nr:MAG: hypothetical protein KatS3mg015_2690 [Fimbriimonadales bacterium]
MTDTSPVAFAGADRFRSWRQARRWLADKLPSLFVWRYADNELRHYFGVSGRFAGSSYAILAAADAWSKDAVRTAQRIQVVPRIHGTDPKEHRCFSCTLDVNKIHICYVGDYAEDILYYSEMWVVRTGAERYKMYFSDAPDLAEVERDELRYRTTRLSTLVDQGLVELRWPVLQGVVTEAHEVSTGLLRLDLRCDFRSGESLPLAMEMLWSVTGSVAFIRRGRGSDQLIAVLARSFGRGELTRMRRRTSFRSSLYSGEVLPAFGAGMAMWTIKRRTPPCELLLWYQGESRCVTLFGRTPADRAAFFDAVGTG